MGALPKDRVGEASTAAECAQGVASLELFRQGEQVLMIDVRQPGRTIAADLLRAAHR